MPHIKALLPAIQNGSTEKAVTILSELSHQIRLSQQHLHDVTAPTPGILKPVSQTCLTGSDVDPMDTSDSPEPTCVDNETGSIGAKPVTDTSKTSVDDDVDLQEAMTRKTRRKRRNELKSDPQSIKRQCSKAEEETMGLDVISMYTSVAMEKGGNMLNSGGEGVEFDVSVLMETGVDNCNILHVCCGGDDGYMMTFDPSPGE